MAVLFFLFLIGDCLNNCFVMDGLAVLLESRPPGWILVYSSISVKELFRFSCLKNGIVV